jgi:Raf kinase inhibitor-like YbhB/YbcL family protein
MAFMLTSSSFGAGEQIPVSHSCDGLRVSPPLSWSDPPHGTKSLALIVEDPDAPGGDPFVHWIVYNLEPTVDGVPLAAGSGRSLPANAVHGHNQMGRADYFPPCPPEGRHRYVFRLFALDVVLRERSAMTKQDLQAAMSGHVLGVTELVGTYARQSAAAAREVPA